MSEVDWKSAHDVVLAHHRETFSENMVYIEELKAERDAVLGREAALREENSDLSDALYESEERSASRGRQSSAFEDRMGDLQIQNGKLKDRLTESHQREARLQDMVTAADERADVLEGLLMECQGLAMFTLSNGLRDRIDAALKPAEGVGDEQ